MYLYIYIYTILYIIYIYNIIIYSDMRPRPWRNNALPWRPLAEPEAEPVEYKMRCPATHRHASEIIRNYVRIHLGADIWMCSNINRWINPMTTTRTHTEILATKRGSRRQTRRKNMHATKIKNNKHTAEQIASPHRWNALRNIWIGKTQCQQHPGHQLISPV